MNPSAPERSTAGVVLIADDNPDARYVLDLRVKRAGYQTILVENGRRALEVVASEPVDAILLDINMPEKDGFEVLAAIKADPQHAHVPIVIIAGGGDQEDWVRCIELGAVDYLAKPFNQEKLRARLATCIAAKRQRDRELRDLQQAAVVPASLASTPLPIPSNPPPLAAGSQSSDESSSMPKQVGRITLGRLLGSGRLGQVFLGHHDLLGLPLAVKLLQPKQRDDPEQRARILREARVAARLSHPNIVPLYEVGEAGPNIYLALEYVEGGTLADLLDRQPMRRLDVPTTLRILKDVATGLGEINRNGLTHRDIKPGNLLLTRDGVVKIADLALAKPSGAAAAAATLTAEHVIIGTPAYMAPEQIEGSPDLDIRCDLYALGVVLYEMLTGRLPFEGKTNLFTMFAHVATTPLAPSTVCSEVPDWLDRLCMKLLAKDRSERYPTPEAVIVGLSAAQVNDAITAHINRIVLTYQFPQDGFPQGGPCFPCW